MKKNEITKWEGYNNGQFIPPLYNAPGCLELIGKFLLIGVLSSILHLLLGC